MSEADKDLFSRMRLTADEAKPFQPRRARVEGWEAKLVAIIDERMAKPFDWGTSDCCLFACDVIQVLRGSDPAAWFRGRYSNIGGAVAALREFSDGGTLEDVAVKISEEQGFDEIPPAFAQRGDCVLVDSDAGSALGIQIDHRVVVQGPAGLTITSDVRVLRAWAV